MPVRQVVRLTLAAVVVVVFTACGTKTYFTTADDPIGPVCVHLNMPYSDRICPDSNASNYFATSNVSAETLVVRTVDGRNIRIALPNHTDAIFLTRSAMSTFLVRHYDATNPPRAAETRAFIAEKYR